MLYKINSKFEATITLNGGKEIKIENKKLFDLIYLLETSHNVKITEEKINILIKYNSDQINKALNEKSFRKSIIEKLEEI